jgi:hypothetical protein
LSADESGRHSSAGKLGGGSQVDLGLDCGDALTQIVDGAFSSVYEPSMMRSGAGSVLTLSMMRAVMRARVRRTVRERVAVDEAGDARRMESTS